MDIIETLAFKMFINEYFVIHISTDTHMYLSIYFRLHLSRHLVQPMKMELRIASPSVEGVTSWINAVAMTTGC